MNRAAALLCAVLLLTGCASVDVVRLQPDLLRTPNGTEPLAGIQTTCLGFYLFTVGIPEADLDKAVNELLLKEAKKIGADGVINLQFSGTPGSGIWWLTKLFGFRSASASAIAVVAEPGAETDHTAAPPVVLPPPASQPAVP